jgi:hypothetical protein
MNWFECKVSYDKIAETGVTKKVTKLYLVDALSHAEAEARTIEEMKPYISGEFEVSSVRRVRYNEIFTNEHSGCWWKAKVSFITLDEKTGSEKRNNVSVLTAGNDIEDAIFHVKEGMKGTLADYEITEVKPSNILDIFIYGK